MKALTALALLGLSVGALNPALADPFNDRGPDLIAALPAGSDKPYTGAVVPSKGFNDRGEDVIAALPAGSDKPYTGAVVPSKGFNDRV